MGWAALGLPGPPQRPSGLTPEQYMAGIAAAAAQRAEVARQRAAEAAPPPLPACRVCSDAPGSFGHCSCVTDCRHANCWVGPLQGRADMPGRLRASYPVPRFVHCPTYEELTK